MREPWDWEESDIADMIERQVEESLTLDYKACDALANTDGKKSELSKDVSAFANSAGGVIIYGVREGKDHKPEAIDIGYGPGDVNKEWLEQVINSRIQRRIDGVRINPVRLHSGRIIYVVAVPQSIRAPHMAADHRFYKRFNFLSVHMEEYEVRDVSRRSEAPDLAIKMVWREAPAGIVAFDPYIYNKSIEPASHAVVRLFCDVLMQPLEMAKMQSHAGSASVQIDAARVTMNVFSKTWTSPPQLPIWYGEHQLLLGRAINLALPMGESTHYISWEISAPKMSVKTGYYGLARRPKGIGVVSEG